MAFMTTLLHCTISFGNCLASEKISGIQNVSQEAIERLDMSIDRVARAGQVT
jgi:hypothetical protein